VALPGSIPVLKKLLKRVCPSGAILVTEELIMWYERISPTRVVLEATLELMFANASLEGAKMVLLDPCREETRAIPSVVLKSGAANPDRPVRLAAVKAEARPVR
jgi:hypothetical protein